MDPFPDDVRRFIAGFVETVDQLEVLRVLSDRPEAVWDATALMRDAEADLAAAAGVLASLQARGLLVAEKRGGGTTYRYGPVTPELAASVTRLLTLYRERPVSTIKLVYARQRDPVRSLADAFRIRKEG